MQTFDVRMPDGTLIRGVPEGTTQDELQAKLDKRQKTQPQNKLNQPAKQENSTLDDVAAYGQVASEAVTAGILGDEAVAFSRAGIDSLVSLFSDTMGGTGDFYKDYQMYLEDARQREKNFRKENPGVSLATDISGGLLTGFGVAGAIPNAATRYGNVLRQGGAAGAEGLVRGFMEGEGLEDRAKGAAIQGGAGAVLGGLGGTLMRGQQSIDELAELAASRSGANAEGVGIAGKEGFSSDAEVLKQAGKATKTFNNFTESLQDLGAKYVSPRFGALLNRADGYKMREQSLLIDTLQGSSGKELQKLDRFFKSKKGQQVALDIANSGAKVNGVPLSPGARMQILDEAGEKIRAFDDTLGDTWQKMRDSVDDLATRDIGNEATGGFFPRRFDPKVKDKEQPAKLLIGGKGGKVSSSNIDSEMPLLKSTRNYKTPVAAYLDYMEDVTSADSLVRSFGLDIAPGSGGKSNTRTVINEIGKKIASEGGSQSNVDLGKDVLEAFAVNSAKGPNEIAQTLRTATSVALLGTPENAVLQLGELGVAAYKNGVTNTVATLPKVIKSVLGTRTDDIVARKPSIVDKNGDLWRAPDLGITNQYLGEIKRDGQNVVNQFLDFSGKTIMSGMGVRKANRLGQESLINGAFRNAKKMAEKNPDRLADLKSTRGWSKDEVAELARDLKSGEQTDAVRSFLFTTLSDIQPVSPSALPKSYADNPNGRLLYAMKTYMVKQLGIMRNDIWGKAREAERLGLGTKEGQAALRQAVKQSAKYVALVPAINAVVDEKRKAPRTGSDNYDPVASTTRQLVSNATAGVVDTQSYLYGGDVASGLIPPAYQAPARLVEGGMSFVRDGEPDDILKVFKTYVPGVRQGYWFKDLISSEDDR